jgi:hypothetical protein
MLLTGEKQTELVKTLCFINYVHSTYRKRAAGLTWEVKT